LYAYDVHFKPIPTYNAKCDGIRNDTVWEQVEFKGLLTKECHLQGYGAMQVL
jgi:hypothetical protein